MAGGPLDTYGRKFGLSRYRVPEKLSLQCRLDASSYGNVAVVQAARSFPDGAFVTFPSQ